MFFVVTNLYSKDIVLSDSLITQSVNVEISKKSYGKFIKNFVFPGLGFENRKMRTIYSSVEIVNISSLIYFIFRGENLKKRVASFGAYHSGYYTTDKNLWNKMKIFKSISGSEYIYGYNDYNELFNTKEPILDESKYYWNWDSVDNMQEFNELVNLYSKNMGYISLTIGSMILNRLISSVFLYVQKNESKSSLVFSTNSVNFIAKF